MIYTEATSYMMYSSRLVMSSKCVHLTRYPLQTSTRLVCDTSAKSPVSVMRIRLSCMACPQKRVVQIRSPEKYVLLALEFWRDYSIKDTVKMRACML